MPTKISNDVAVWQAALMPVAADLAVLDVPVAVEVLVAVELVPLSKFERLGSVVKTAVRPVTLVQSRFGVPVPATKLTAEHWNTSGLRVRSHY